MDQEFKYDVCFIYSREDDKAILELAERLKHDGLSVWIYQWGIRPGENWLLKMRIAIEQSRLMIVAISKNSSKSSLVRKGWEIASLFLEEDSRRRVIPLLLDDSKIPPSLASLVYVDWRRQPNDQYRLLLDACRPSAAEDAGKNKRPGANLIPQFWLVS